MAVLDLGSTTFHLQHFLVTETGIVESLHDEKRTLCLGERVFQDGTLDAEVFAESLDAAAELVGICRARRPDHLTVVATSAIRSATNGFELVREIERRNRVSVRIVGPDEEARLAYVAQGMSPEFEGRRLAVIDLGGGSVEFGLGEGPKCHATESLPLGALRVRAAMEGAPVDARLLREVRELVRTRAGPTAARVREFGPEVLVFGSGSARAARRLAMRESQAPGGAGPIDVGLLEQSMLRHLGLSAAELVQRGVDPRRAGSVLIATAILAELVDLCDGVSTHVSCRGLRDGVAMETYRALTRGRRDVSALAYPPLRSP